MFNRSICWLICMFTAVSMATLYRDPDYTKEWPVTESIREARKGAGEELGALLDAGAGAVVTLQAGGMRLAVHRSVLTARSPTLAAMLRHYSVEADGGRLSVTDVEGPVLRHLVAYLYTLRVPWLRPGAATQLLAAAHRFGLSALQADCEQQVTAQLSAQTAASVAVLAVKHSLGDLRDTAVNFIKDHFFEVLATKGWSDAVKNQPKEVIELSRLLAGQASKSSAAATVETGATPTVETGATPTVETGATPTVETGATPTVEAGATPTAQLHSDHRTSPAAAVLTATNSTPTTAGADVSRLLILPQEIRQRMASRLLQAASDGRVREVWALLVAGVSKDARNEADGDTALHLAISKGHATTAKCLLDGGLDVNAVNNRKRTPLHLAAQRGDVNLVWMLVVAAARIDAQDDNGQTPLHVAAQKHRSEVVSALLLAGSRKDIKDINGETPESIASVYTRVPFTTYSDLQ